MEKVVYFDKVFPALIEVMMEKKPANMSIDFLYLLDAVEQERALAEADYIMLAALPLTRGIMQKAVRTRMIQKNGIGVDNIELQAAADLKIPVCNTPGGNAGSVSEMTMGLILALSRKLQMLDKATKNGEWLMWEMRPSSFEISGKVHGIIGFGNIGKAVAKLSQGFGTRVAYFDARRLSPTEEETLGVQYMTLEELLANSDIVSIHLPLLPETRGLIGQKQLALMKPTSILVNVARGNIVDETALYEVLSNNRISGAAVDVWSKEPIAADNPLLKLENIIATPHIAAGTRDTLLNIFGVAFENLTRVSMGNKPQFVVNGVADARVIK